MIITQVDAFTDTVFAGNPAAVCLLPEPRGGVVRVEVEGSRVKLLGQAVTVFVAELSSSGAVSGP